MLARVLEPEAMDSPADAADYDAMDHAEVNRRFAADLLAFVGEPPAGELLDLGTGTAQIPLELCGQHPRVRVLAVDLADSMLALAAANVRAAGLGGRIRLKRVDAKQLPYADGSLAGVISNSIVHHIAEPAAVLIEAVRVTCRGGVLFFRDLSRPDDELALERLVQTYTAGANAHQRQLLADSLRAALRVDEVRDVVAGLGFDPQTVQPTSDRHWTWAARR